MPALADRPAYAYRDDPAVPDFDDSSPIAFVDGSCALCSASARVIARHDRSGAVRIATVQSPLGRAMLAHFGLDPADPDTWLFLEDGQAHTALDGAIRLGRRLGPVGWLLQPFRALPRSARDWLYARLARNRYRLFGRADLCALPSENLRRRLLEP